MKWAAISVLLLGLALGIPAPAQPGAAVAHGGVHFGGRGFAGHRGVRGFEHRGFHRHTFDGGFGAAFVPFWWDEPFAYDSYVDATADEEAPAQPPATPPTVIMRDRAPALPATPKMIEVPLGPNTVPVPQQFAVFVLKDGTRIEPQRYLVTADNAYLTTDRRQRTIPLSQLDIAATISANHARGIDLRIPLDRNEISLSF
jgi:hypothetical protein